MPDEGEVYEVVAKTRDIEFWERTHRGRTVKTLTEQQSLTQLYEVAYVAAKRRGLCSGTYEDFRDSTDLEVVDGDDEGADPTPSAA